MNVKTITTLQVMGEENASGGVIRVEASEFPVFRQQNIVISIDNDVQEFKTLASAILSRGEAIELRDAINEAIDDLDGLPEIRKF